jgi:hypothetical protein
VWLLLVLGVSVVVLWVSLHSYMYLSFYVPIVFVFVVLCVNCSMCVMLILLDAELFCWLEVNICWLEVSIRKVLRPATSTQGFLGFPVSIRKF